jgi:hypothetical protein
VLSGSSSALATDETTRMNKAENEVKRIMDRAPTDRLRGEAL